jgi:hypothetical protein
MAAWWRPADPPGEIVNGRVPVRPGLRPSWLAGYLAAISVAHHSSGVADTTNPTQHPPSRYSAKSPPLMQPSSRVSSASRRTGTGQWDFHFAVAPVRFAGTSGSLVNPIATF